MSAKPARRHTTTRDRHRAAIRRTKPPCSLCGGEIDYSLHYLDPGAFVVDHVVPLARGGADTLENKAAAHRRCNGIKGDKAPEEQGEMRAPRTFVTSRTW